MRDAEFPKVIGVWNINKDPHFSSVGCSPVPKLGLLTAKEVKKVVEEEKNEEE